MDQVPRPELGTRRGHRWCCLIGIVADEGFIFLLLGESPLDAEHIYIIPAPAHAASLSTVAIILLIFINKSIQISNFPR